MSGLKLIGLDFETFSEVSLPEKGLENYVAHHSFQPILASIAEKGYDTVRFDLVKEGYREFETVLQGLLSQGYTIVAHNAGFERRVLKWLGFKDIDHRVVDSAVMSRLLGAGSKLEVASRQLTTTAKRESGRNLMPMFSWPHEEYDAPSVAYNEAHPDEWEEYGYYCDVDAEAGLEIVLAGLAILVELGELNLWERECRYELLTAAQNQQGWFVDKESVHWMDKRAWANTEIAKAQFLQSIDEDLNFNSPIQLKKFCHARGVKVQSLDKYQAPVWLERVNQMLQDTSANGEQLLRWAEVKTMLEIKLEIGGSSLRKLPVILNLLNKDGRVRHQYMHLGAGQTFRTTGVGIQMQNLARLAKVKRDLATLQDYSVEWTNTDMAGQLRQVFMAEHPEGELFVGDFAGVESRALAWLADEEWKLEVARKGLDLYMMLVAKYDDIAYEDVTEEARPKGKYSELSAGYQASAKAVMEFMFRLGFVITLEEAQEWVTSWREACPNIVAFWKALDDLLHLVVATKLERSFFTARGLEVRMTPFVLPTVSEVHPGATSICIRIFQPGTKDALITRFVHGVYSVGRGLAYYKATETLGDKGLWSNVNETATQKANQGKKPNQKRVQILNTVYGGKVAGIVTQSLCREVFFERLERLDKVLETTQNIGIVGQFHDEVIVEWWPRDPQLEGSISAHHLETVMHEVMSESSLIDFPLDAEIKHAHRYIK